MAQDHKAFDEESFRNAAAAHLLRCRPGDWAHAQRVVSWVKRLEPPKELAPSLIMAAYIHDIGWRDVVPPNQTITLNELLYFEPTANKNSTLYVKDFLEKQNVSSKTVKDILRYVAAADEHRASKEDEKYIVDADNLSKLDIAHLKEKFQKSEWQKLLMLWETTLQKQVQTTKGKILLPGLLSSLREQIAKES